MAGFIRSQSANSVTVENPLLKSSQGFPPLSVSVRGITVREFANTVITTS